MAEIHFVQTGCSNLGKGIEGSPGKMTGQAHLIKPPNHEISSSAVLLLHPLYLRGPVGEGLDGGFLAEDRSAHHAILMNLHHGIDQPTGTTGETNPEASHGEGLGKAMQKKGSLLHAGQGSQAEVLALVGQFGINFVADHDQVLLHRELGQPLELFTVRGSSRRVGRKV